MTLEEIRLEMRARRISRLSRWVRWLGIAIVPITPTVAMLEAAYYDALEEDARGVWDTMIREATRA